MAKDLPYFKFFSSEWNDGDITLEDYHTQGVFINVCSYYWSRECNLETFKLYKRFRGCEDTLDLLYSSSLISEEKGFAKIKFLDRQWEEREAKKATMKANGLKGGRPKKNQKVSEEETKSFSEKNQTITNIEKKREEKKREDNNSLSWLDTAKGEYLDFCEKYYQMLLKHGRVKKNTNWKTKAWYDAARLLIERDGETLERIHQVLDYVNENIDDQYLPQVWSVPSLREKLLKVDSHSQRNKQVNFDPNNWSMS